MSEASILRAIQKLASQSPKERALIEGIGDDCAILRPPRGYDLVFTSDFVLEDRHFTRNEYTAADVGHKALARSLSDLAAMGAKPLFCLVSLGAPGELGEPWIRGFYRGLLNLGRQHGITLAGGDLARNPQVVVDITCCGTVPKGSALLRSGARPGDRIYVSGELGGTAQALRESSSPHRRSRLRRPQPRVALGERLRRLPARACMDLSDGLSIDLHRLCLASGVAAELTGELPLAREATLQDALHGGEDYELLFTAAPKVRVPARLADLPLHPIGEIIAGRPGSVRFHGKRLRPSGYDHFDEHHD